jgi:hypothetical protein
LGITLGEIKIMQKLGLAALAAGCSLVMASAAMAQQMPQVTSGSPDLTTINSAYMITPEQALTWANFKAGLGPTYNGSVGGTQWVNFIMTTAQELGGINPYVEELPYNFYTVPDWPNAATHIYGSGVEVEKMISNGTPVPVVASYGMTSGATPTTGLTAPMVFCPSVATSTGVTTTCPANIAGKIVVCAIPPYPAASPGINGPYAYSSSILGSYTYTDGEVRVQANPVGNFPLFTPVPPTVIESFYGRWNWSGVSSCITQGKAGNAAGMVWVYDLSPGASFGLTQRSVYNAANSPVSTGGPGTVYQNLPTIALDRVNGAKVITDAQNGATATMWLLPTGVNNNCSSTQSTVNGSPSCGFVPTQGRYVVVYLPGKYYGTPQDQWVDIATHSDAMSLVEEDGALGMLGVMNYMNQIPQSQRPKTLEFWFDGRHFMPGAESAWTVFDYFVLFPQLDVNRVGYFDMEHMGGRNTQETGTPDGLGADTYTYVDLPAQDGGDIDALINIQPNNPWLINTVQKGATDNNWFRVWGTSGGDQPGMQGGYQKTVLSAECKGSPCIGLAGDWPGSWTQSYSQYYTEAATAGDVSTTTGSVPGFDENYFVTEVAGISEMAGMMMAQSNLIIVANNSGWASLASGLLCTTSAICTTTPATGQLPNSQFVTPANATAQRAQLVSQFQTAFQYVEQGQYTKAIDALQTLEQNVNAWILNPNQTALDILINNQIQALLALPPVYTHDFSGAGISDVLWRNSGGNVGMWLMNGTSIYQTAVLGGVASNWSIVGQRDFTGSGYADILWRDTSGNLGMWLMNGTQIVSAPVIGNVPTNWSVAATGCFDGSGVGDIVWRDTVGDVAIWFMKGANVVKSVVVGNVSTNWVIAGADMHGHIFWRNTVTGEAGMWVMNGTTIAQTVDWGVVPLSWTIAGIGDFDGQLVSNPTGTFGIVWRDTSGNVGIWLLNGTSIYQTAVLGQVPLTTTLAETGDFNGDGKSDILWIDSLGNVSVWFMDGATISSTYTYGNVGTSWTVQAMNAD